MSFPVFCLDVAFAFATIFWHHLLRDVRDPQFLRDTFSTVLGFHVFELAIGCGRHEPTQFTGPEDFILAINLRQQITVARHLDTKLETHLVVRFPFAPLSLGFPT